LCYRLGTPENARHIGAEESFRAGRTAAHNGAVTDRQSTDQCPQCRSATAVHSISELAAMAKNQLNQPSPGFPAAPQPGYASPPQPGYSAQPQPGYSAEPQPGYAAEPQPGHGSNQSQGRRPGQDGFLDPSRPAQGLGDAVAGEIEGAIAGIALGAAARFIGRKIGRRVQQAYTERVVPAMAARQESMLREQVAIAERHPDIRACLTDGVIFLAGGSRVLPMPRLDTLTVQQADALVAQLRQY
jgi:hypothetical protein